jgi:hypothetical protein
MRLRALAAGGCALAVLAMPATANAATLSTSQAKKLAKAAVLTPKDLKGWEFEASKVEPGDNADEKAMYKCLGLAKPSFTARNRGYSISSPSQPLEIDSSADVASSTARATAYLKAQQSKKGASCAKKLIVDGLTGLGAQDVKVSVKQVPITVAGADRDVAFHVAVSGTGLAIDGYVIEAQVGRTEISVSPVRFDGSKPSLAQSRALTETLVKRVRAL